MKQLMQATLGPVATGLPTDAPGVDTRVPGAHQGRRARMSPTDYLLAETSIGWCRSR
jgi:hypothetical protein